MEGRVDHARLHALGNVGVQRDLADTAVQGDEIAVAHPALFGVEGMDFEYILLVPETVGGSPRLRADIVLRQDWPVVRRSGNRGPTRSSVAMYSVGIKRPLPRTKRSTCMIGVPSGAASLHGH